MHSTQTDRPHFSSDRLTYRMAHGSTVAMGRVGDGQPERRQPLTGMSICDILGARQLCNDEVETRIEILRLYR